MNKLNSMTSVAALLALSVAGATIQQPKHMQPKQQMENAVKQNAVLAK